MDLPGIPESIPRARVVELVEAFGLDLRDLLSVSVQRHAIAAEVFARNEQGQRFTNDGENLATHSILIPIVEEPSPADR
ncbi:hypothetical protein [Nonomuraea angiospora]|uniref:hypothetical protein n=1 Tax=Nonomuraea angiospora TaxID=46172 RepID=UPI0029A441F0|nr:hypothetical protein [Nonomuraea angiospora]MDX3110159.1 hypothetical protein [Nonomuraea angiospora]